MSKAHTPVGPAIPPASINFNKLNDALAAGAEPAEALKGALHKQKGRHRDMNKERAAAAAEGHGDLTAVEPAAPAAAVGADAAAAAATASK